MTYGTVAALYKRTATSTQFTAVTINDSNGENRVCLDNSGFNQPIMTLAGADSVGSITTTANWTLQVARKATGSVVARHHLYDYTDATWSHGDGNAALANLAAGIASGATVKMKNEFGGYPNGLIAVIGVWKNTTVWASDAAVTTAGLHTSLQSWVDSAPTALWAFNQAATTIPVNDLTAGGANQTSLVGTTVVTGSDPPGFDFTIAGAATVTNLSKLDRAMKRRIFR
jgi:hypothetical protein